MEALKHLRKSKSELIIDLGNPVVHDKTLKAIFDSRNIKIPTSYMFKDSSERNKWAKYILENRRFRFYKLLNRKDPNFQSQFSNSSEEFLLLNKKDLVDIPHSLNTENDILILSKLGLKKIKKYLNILDIQKDIKITADSIDLFYRSCIIYKYKCLSTEMCLLKALEQLFKNKAASKDVLRFVFIKFSNSTILKYIKANAFNIKEAFEFLKIISSKLSKNVIEIWFNNNFDVQHDIFSKLNHIEITENTKFNSKIFESLLGYKQYRKHVFNYWNNLEFMREIKSYTNRADYDYYYDDKNIQHQYPLPKDFLEFDFFYQFQNKRNYSKICNYLLRVGYSPAFRIFIHSNINKILSDDQSLDYIYTIGSEILKFDDSYDIHRIMWDKLKLHESIFRKLINYFKVDIDPILYNLIKGVFSFNVNEIEPYINFGYEEELTKYFKTINLDQILSISNEWNKTFILKALSIYNFSNSDEYVKIIKYIQELKFNSLSEESQLYVAYIYSNLFKIDDQLIFEALNINMRFLYSCDNIKYIPDFISQISPNDCKIQEASWIHKCLSIMDSNKPSHIDLDQLNVSSCKTNIHDHSNKLYDEKLNINEHSRININIKKNISDNKSANIFYKIGSGKYQVIENDLLKSLFSISYIAKDVSKYYFVEYFDRIVDIINKDISREAACSTALKECDFKFEYPLSENQNKCSLKNEIDGFLISNGCENLVVPSNKLKKINFQLKDPFIDQISMNNIEDLICFILSSNISNKYTLYILFDRVLSILTGDNSNAKILLLKYVNPSLLTDFDSLRYLNVLIPLLNNTNNTICMLAKSSLNKIVVQNKEIQSILQDITQSLVGKQYVPMFFKSIRSLVFNNYLCFNSLNLVLQVLFKYIQEFTEDVLDILGKISHITKDKDFRSISKMVFCNLNKFVINNQYHSSDVLKIATLYSLYVEFDDFVCLTDYLSSIKICSYLVGILKFKSDSVLNRNLIEFILHGTKPNINNNSTDIILSTEPSYYQEHDVSFNKTKNDILQIHPTFIATACELKEFNEYLAVFIPILKEMFVSQSVEKREISARAIKQILSSNPDNKILVNTLETFMVQCAVCEDFSVRLLCLDITEYLPIIFILRNDIHFLVRKKAYDIWKDKVYNTNKQLRIIYSEILDFVSFGWLSTFGETLKAVLSEMIAKYATLLELYIQKDHCISNSIVKELLQSEKLKNITIKDDYSEDDPSTIKLSFSEKLICKNLKENMQNYQNLSNDTIKEFILLESIKINKLMDLSHQFCIEKSSVALFNCLFSINQYRDNLLRSMNRSVLLDLCYENNDVAYGLYSVQEDDILLKFFSDKQIISVINKKLDLNLDIAQTNILSLIDMVGCSREMEDLLLNNIPQLSYHYLINHSVDCGRLRSVFMRAFDYIKNIDNLVVRRNLAYLKYVSFKNVTNFDNLLNILMEDEDKIAFDRCIEIITEKKISTTMLFVVSGYLLRNLLMDSRYNQAEKAIKLIYEKEKENLGYFRIIMERVLIGN